MTAPVLQLTANDTALLVHDMSNGVSQGPSAPAAAIVRPLAALIGLARELGMPVIYTHVVAGPQFEASAVRRLKFGGVPEAMREGNPLSEIVADLAPAPADLVVRKTRYSAFYETGLEDALRTLGVRHLIIGGFGTNVGVEATARDAEHRDLIPIVLSDCTAAHRAELHAASLATIDAYVGFVWTSARVFASLRSRTSAQAS